MAKGSVDDTYVQCRALGHEWRHQGRFVNGPTVFLLSVCADCGTERTKLIGRHGTLEGTRYKWPDNYSRHGEDRMSALDWRSTFVETLF